MGEKSALARAIRHRRCIHRATPTPPTNHPFPTLNTKFLPVAISSPSRHGVQVVAGEEPTLAPKLVTAVEEDMRLR